MSQGSGLGTVQYFYNCLSEEMERLSIKFAGDTKWGGIVNTSEEGEFNAI